MILFIWIKSVSTEIYLSNILQSLFTQLSKNIFYPTIKKSLLVNYSKIPFTQLFKGSFKCGYVWCICREREHCLITKVRHHLRGSAIRWVIFNPSRTGLLDSLKRPCGGQFDPPYFLQFFGLQ